MRSTTPYSTVTGTRDIVRHLLLPDAARLFVGAPITFIADGSLMVSYVRARAEGLGLECKVGFMQRPERVVLTPRCHVLRYLW